MSFVVTLTDYAPPGRSDGISFTAARIEESESKDGSWTDIVTIPFAPDADPEHPDPHELTTHNAILAEGWYRVSWLDNEGGESTPTAPIQNTGDFAGGVRPSVTDVAALLRARTNTEGGREAGTFNSKTRPTADQVEALIDEAEDEVLGKVQTPTAESSYERRVRGAIRLYTAILIETSYFPEQVGSGRSPVATYEKLYAARSKALIAEGETGEPQGDGTGDAPADPYWGFADVAGGTCQRW